MNRHNNREAVRSTRDGNRDDVPPLPPPPIACHFPKAAVNGAIFLVYLLLHKDWARCPFPLLSPPSSSTPLPLLSPTSPAFLISFFMVLFCRRFFPLSPSSRPALLFYLNFFPFLSSSFSSVLSFNFPSIPFSSFLPSFFPPAFPFHLPFFYFFILNFLSCTVIPTSSSFLLLLLSPPISLLCLSSRTFSPSLLFTYRSSSSSPFSPLLSVLLPLSLPFCSLLSVILLCLSPFLFSPFLPFLSLLY